MILYNYYCHCYNGGKDNDVDDDTSIESLRIQSAPSLHVVLTSANNTTTKTTAVLSVHHINDKSSKFETTGQLCIDYYLSASTT